MVKKRTLKNKRRKYTHKKRQRNKLNKTKKRGGGKKPKEWILTPEQQRNEDNRRKEREESEKNEWSGVMGGIENMDDLMEKGRKNEENRKAQKESEIRMVKKLNKYLENVYITWNYNNNKNNLKDESLSDLLLYLPEYDPTAKEQKGYKNRTDNKSQADMVKEMNQFAYKLAYANELKQKENYNLAHKLNRYRGYQHINYKDRRDEMCRSYDYGSDQDDDDEIGTSTDCLDLFKNAIVVNKTNQGIQFDKYLETLDIPVDDVEAQE